MSSRLFGIFTALILTNSISHAMQLTNGEDKGGLVPYRQDSSSDSKSVADFSSASQAKVKLEQQVGPNDFIQIDAMIRYLGDKIDGLPDFHEYLSACIKNYQYGKKFDEPVEVSVTDEDKIKLANFSKFALDNLFVNSFSETTANNEFKEFKQNYSGKGLDRISFPNNSIMYSLMYFFSQNKTPVEVTHNFRSYNGYKFTFLPCSQKDGGTPMEFVFNKDDIRFGNYVQISKDSKDTVMKHLSTSLNGFIGASYKFTFFKIAENTYRLVVNLAVAKSSLSNEMEDKNIAHMIVEIK